MEELTGGAQPVCAPRPRRTLTSDEAALLRKYLLDAKPLTIVGSVALSKRDSHPVSKESGSSGQK